MSETETCLSNSHSLIPPYLSNYGLLISVKYLLMFSFNKPASQLPPNGLETLICSQEHCQGKSINVLSLIPPCQCHLHQASTRDQPPGTNTHTHNHKRHTHRHMHLRQKCILSSISKGMRRGLHNCFHFQFGKKKKIISEGKKVNPSYL